MVDRDVKTAANWVKEGTTIATRALLKEEDLR
jgi:hypothetical protein